MVVVVFPELILRQSVGPGVAEQGRFHNQGHAHLVGRFVPPLGPDVGVQTHRHASRLADPAVEVDRGLLAQLRVELAAGVAGGGQEVDRRAVEDQLVLLGPELAESESHAPLVPRAALFLFGERGDEVVQVRIFRAPEPRLLPRGLECDGRRRLGGHGHLALAQPHVGVGHVGSQRHGLRLGRQVRQRVVHFEGRPAHRGLHEHVVEEDVAAGEDRHRLPDADVRVSGADRRHQGVLRLIDVAHAARRPGAGHVLVDHAGDVLHPNEEQVRPVRLAGAGDLHLERLPAAVVAAHLGPVHQHGRDEPRRADAEEQALSGVLRRRLERPAIPEERFPIHPADQRRHADRFPLGVGARG